MNSLVFNFIKRAVIVPVVCAALAAAVLIFAGPRAVAKTAAVGNKTSNTVKTLDITAFSAKSYEGFSELKSGDFIGSVSSEDIGFGEKAISYHAAEDGSIIMSKASKEPWNGGSLLLIGANTSDSFKPLHRCQIGDTFKVSFYNKDVYTYRLTKILPCEEEKKLSSHLGENRLLLCLQYYDFTNLGNDYFYQVFVAEMV